MNELLNKIEFNQGVIYYEKLGEGIPIIFIHPPGLGRKVFYYQKHLANEYQLILPDLSGHGKSRSQLNGSIIKQYITEIKMILDHEGIEQCIICGYSAGGMIAQEFVLNYPLQTKAVILSGGYPKVATLGLKLQYDIGMKIMQASPDRLAKILAYSHARDKDYRNTLYQHIKESSFQHWYRFYEETYQYDCVNKLKQISQPLVTIYGEHAFWTNKHRDYYNQCMINETVFINNGFHQLPTKNWQAFNEIVRQFILAKVIQ